MLWRNRLCSISWFMRSINEPLARDANKEDDCTGRFWEGRFKSQALLDDKALLACMAYVDLNPIRASIAKTLKTSKHTSIKSRLIQLKTGAPTITTKLKFINNKPGQNIKSLPFSTDDYLKLAEWTSFKVTENKKGSSVKRSKTILDNLDISEEHLLYMTKNFESKFKNLVGGVLKLKSAVKSLNIKNCAGLSNCLKFFGS